MLSRAPERRPDSASLVAAELRDIETSLGGPAAADAPWHSDVAHGVRAAAALRAHDDPRDSRWCRRRPEPTSAPVERAHGSRQDPTTPSPMPRRSGRSRAGRSGRRRGRRTPQWILIGAATVAVAVLAAGILWSAHGSPPAPTDPDARSAARTRPSTTCRPGAVTIAARRTGGKITFTWTYDGALATDTFLWRLAGSDTTTAAKQPSVAVAGQTGGPDVHPGQGRAGRRQRQPGLVPGGMRLMKAAGHAGAALRSTARADDGDIVHGAGGRRGAADRVGGVRRPASRSSTSTLDDGGIWVTSDADHLFGRLNKPAGQLDAAFYPPGGAQRHLQPRRGAAGRRRGRVGQGFRRALPGRREPRRAGRRRRAPDRRRRPGRTRRRHARGARSGQRRRVGRARRRRPAASRRSAPSTRPSKKLATVGVKGTPANAALAVGVDGTVYAVSAAGRVATVEATDTGFAPPQYSQLEPRCAGGDRDRRRQPARRRRPVQRHRDRRPAARSPPSARRPAGPPRTPPSSPQTPGPAATDVVLATLDRARLGRPVRRHDHGADQHPKRHAGRAGPARQLRPRGLGRLRRRLRALLRRRPGAAGRARRQPAAGRAAVPGQPRRDRAQRPADRRHLGSVEPAPGRQLAVGQAAADQRRARATRTTTNPAQDGHTLPPKAVDDTLGARARPHHAAARARQRLRPVRRDPGDLRRHRARQPARAAVDRARTGRPSPSRSRTRADRCTSSTRSATAS